MMLGYPDILEIQFHNICNANCSVCPYEQYAEQTSMRKMKPALKEKILQDIKDNQSRIKRIIPYFNNEPFIDKDYISQLRWFHENTPSIEIEVSTNLSAFRPEVFREILSDNLIDDLRISFFGGTPETYGSTMPGLNFSASVDKLSQFLQMYKKIETSVQYTIIMVLHPDIDVFKETQALRSLFPGHNLNIRYFGYLDRAGSNDYKNTKVLPSTEPLTLNGCSLKRNEERICISVDGTIPLCSQDWFNRENVGNLNTQTIGEIWVSEHKGQIDKIIAGDVDCPPNFICRDCKLACYRQDGELKLNFSGDRYMTDMDKKKISADGQSLV